MRNKEPVSPFAGFAPKVRNPDMQFIKVCLVILILIQLSGFVGNIWKPTATASCEGDYHVSSSDFMNVNLVRINGYSIYGSSLPVTIE